MYKGKRLNKKAGTVLAVALMGTTFGSFMAVPPSEAEARTFSKAELQKLEEAVPSSTISNLESFFGKRMASANTALATSNAYSYNENETSWAPIDLGSSKAPTATYNYSGDIDDTPRLPQSVLNPKAPEDPHANDPSYVGGLEGQEMAFSPKRGSRSYPTSNGYEDRYGQYDESVSSNQSPSDLRYIDNQKEPETFQESNGGLNEMPKYTPAEFPKEVPHMNDLSYFMGGEEPSFSEIYPEDTSSSPSATFGESDALESSHQEYEQRFKNIKRIKIAPQNKKYLTSRFPMQHPETQIKFSNKTSTGLIAYTQKEVILAELVDRKNPQFNYIRTLPCGINKNDFIYGKKILKENEYGMKVSVAPQSSTRSIITLRIPNVYTQELNTKSQNQ